MLVSDVIYLFFLSNIEGVIVRVKVNSFVVGFEKFLNKKLKLGQV